MQTDQRYQQWLDSKHPPEVPPDFADAVMRRVQMRAARGPERVDALIDRWCTSVWVRIAAVTGGVIVCVLRVVVLFLAVLG